MGPPTSVALEDGAPTPAAQGFARKNGVTVEGLEVVETEKGKYLAVRKKLEGRPPPRFSPNHCLASSLPLPGPRTCTGARPAFASFVPFVGSLPCGTGKSSTSSSKA